MKFPKSGFGPIVDGNTSERVKILFYLCYMLQGKELILATKVFAQENRGRSWYVTISTAILLIASIAGAVSSLPLILRIACCLLATLLLVRMFVIYHDFLHYTILKGSKLAKPLFAIFGMYSLNPPSIWKRSHDHHHKHNSKLHTSSIGSFPIMTKEKFLQISKGEQNLYLFSRHPFTIAIGYFTVFVWGMTLRSLIKNPSKHWDSGLALVLHYGIGLGILLGFGWLSFFLGFFIPTFLSSAFGAYLFYAQHNFPTATFFDKEGWSYIGAALESSSHMKMSMPMRWFTGNIGYHHIHHTNARIPFYRLPEVYAEFPEFQEAKTTSLHPRDIRACFQMKVWDPEQGKCLP